MKIVVFAGGVGKRLWPLSRKNTPKQFQKIFGEQTSLENSYEVIRGLFDVQDIFISTTEKFKDQVFEVIPDLPTENVILEPESRDTGPAVAYAMKHIAHKFPNEPVVIRWQNSLIKNVEAFLQAIQDANKVFDQGDAEFVYLSVPARYPNTAVGYIKRGKQISESQNSDGIYAFEKFTEKPDKDLAETYVQDGNYDWNPGCYITTPKFVLDQLQQVDQQFYQDLMADNFTSLEKKSIDFLLWEHLDPQNVVVVRSDYDWHYISNWADIKTALAPNQADNITRGKVVQWDSQDSLVFNYDKEKLVATAGITGVEVINTPTALLVVDKSRAADIKKLLDQIEEEGLSDYL